MKIGVLLYTYNRTDDARINMEIIRNLWSKNESLKDVVIVHSYNGEKDWWPEKYLEDELLYLPNPGHFAGAEVLMDEGVKTFKEKYPDVDYVILLASDTWCVKPEYLEGVLKKMQKEEKYLATSVWGTIKKDNIWKKGSALDFNIFNLKWAIKNELFPIRYTEFKEKFEDLFLYRDETVYMEPLFIARFIQAISRSEVLPSDNLLRSIAGAHIYRMKEREPVHVDGKENLIFKTNFFARRMYWKKIGLITHHAPEPKQKILRQMKLRVGPAANQLIDTKNLSYYNRGLTKTAYKKKGLNINYGD